MKITTDTSIPTLIAETKRYAQTDMLCYRSPEEKLAEQQRRLWDPVVKWAETHYSIQLHLTEGLMPIDQPAETLAVLEAAVDVLMQGAEESRVRDIAKLTKLLGSVVLALAVIEQEVNEELAIEIAFLEEVSQAKRWGEDEDAAEKRAAKMAECAEIIKGMQ